ncbi:MAG: dipicolinate synthase subunit B [Bacillota bacterium]
MRMKDLTIGFALTGSFCTIDSILPQMEKLVELGADVIPVISYAMDTTDTRFGLAQDFKKRIKEISGKDPIASIEGAEPIGPKAMLDILVVAPCTGNTLAKLANAITDTPVLMACKAHLRNERPVVLSIATNDGLSANAKNIGMLLGRKHIYFVPFGQDDHVKKCNSLVAKPELIIQTIELALQGRQIQPLLIH